MSTEREASCACGQLRVRCPETPLSVSLCHCSDCQRRTGSAFGIAAFFGREDIIVSGDYRTFSREADSGLPVHFHFCASCGSTVFWHPERMAERVAVAVGAFADPDFPAPGKAVYEDRALAWAAGVLKDQTSR
ncbi:MAG: GFA family protein [Minwuia sp.]|uniref:GFA family protein n=1 Tax=Minwuia sp. TaxID=2493630 RepID=UPI003A8A1258